MDSSTTYCGQSHTFTAYTAYTNYTIVSKHIQYFMSDNPINI